MKDEKMMKEVEKNIEKKRIEDIAQKFKSTLELKEFGCDNSYT